MLFKPKVLLFPDSLPKGLFTPPRGRLFSKSRFVETSKILQVGPHEMELVLNPAITLKYISQQVLLKMFTLAAGKNKGLRPVITHYTFQSNRILFLHKEGVLMAYCAMDLLPLSAGTVVLSTGTVIHPSLRKSGLIYAMMHAQLERVLLEHNSDSMYLVSITHSPLIHQRFNSITKMYPAPGESPPEDIACVAKTVAAHIAANKTYDPMMVIRRFYQPTTHDLASLTHRDSTINQWWHSLSKVDNGDAVVGVSKVDSDMMIR